MEARDFDHPDLAVFVQPAIPQEGMPVACRGPCPEIDKIPAREPHRLRGDGWGCRAA
jgi:hypothetical protein